MLLVLLGLVRQTVEAERRGCKAGEDSPRRRGGTKGQYFRKSKETKGKVTVPRRVLCYGEGVRLRVVDEVGSVGERRPSRGMADHLATPRLL